jgi:hypothetical protein
MWEWNKEKGGKLKGKREKRKDNTNIEVTKW